MGTAQKLGIGHGHGGTGPGMNGHGPVILFTEPGDLLQLLNGRIDPRLIHQPQGGAAGALLQGLLHRREHLRALLPGQSPAGIARDARAGAAVAHKNGDVAGCVPVDGVKKFPDAGIDAGGILPVAEKAAADLVQMGRIAGKTNGGQAAVAGDERGDPLTDKRRKVLDRFLFYGEPVVMGVGVKEAGGDGKTLQVKDLRVVTADTLPDLGDFIVLNKNIPKKGIASRTVINFGVFQQLFQRNTS